MFGMGGRGGFGLTDMLGFLHIMGTSAGGDPATVARIMGQLTAGAELLGAPPPPPRVRELFDRAGATVGVPGLLLAAVAAVLTGYKAEHYDGHRVGLMGLPAAHRRDPGGAGVDVERDIQAAAALLVELTRGDEDRGMARALVAYCEAGEPAELADTARRMAGRKLAAEIVGTFLSWWIADLGPQLQDHAAELEGPRRRELEDAPTRLARDIGEGN